MCHAKQSTVSSSHLARYPWRAWFLQETDLMMRDIASSGGMERNPLRKSEAVRGLWRFLFFVVSNRSKAKQAFAPLQDREYALYKNSDHPIKVTAYEMKN